MATGITLMSHAGIWRNISASRLPAGVGSVSGLLSHGADDRDQLGSHKVVETPSFGNFRDGNAVVLILCLER